MRDSFNPGVFFAQQNAQRQQSSKPNNFSNLLGSQPINLKREQTKSNKDTVDLSSLLGNDKRQINAKMQNKSDVAMGQIVNVLLDIKQLIQRLIDGNTSANYNNLASVLNDHLKKTQLAYDEHLDDINFIRQDHLKQADFQRRAFEKFYINVFERYTKDFNFRQFYIDKNISRVAKKYNMTVGSINVYTHTSNQIIGRNQNTSPEVLSVIFLSSIHELIRHFALDFVSYSKGMKQGDFVQDLYESINTSLVQELKTTFFQTLYKIPIIGQLTSASLGILLKGLSAIPGMVTGLYEFYTREKTKDKLTRKYSSQKSPEIRTADAITKVPGLLESQRIVLLSIQEVLQNIYAQDNKLLQASTGQTHSYVRTQNKQERIYVEELGQFLTKAEYSEYSDKKRKAIYKDTGRGFRGTLFSTRKQREKLTERILEQSNINNQFQTDDVLNQLMGGDFSQTGKIKKTNRRISTSSSSGANPLNQLEIAILQSGVSVIKKLEDNHSDFMAVFKKQFNIQLASVNKNIRDYGKEQVKLLQELITTVRSLKFKKIPGGEIHAFAEGGIYSAGKARLVGEKGPEIEVPKVGGKILSNKQISELIAIDYNKLKLTMTQAINVSNIGQAALPKAANSTFNQMKSALDKSQMGLHAKDQMYVSMQERLAALKERNKPAVKATNLTQPGKKEREQITTPKREKGLFWKILDGIIDTALTGAAIAGFGILVAPIVLPLIEKLFKSIFSDTTISQIKEKVLDYVPDFVEDIFTGKEGFFKGLAIATGSVLLGPSVLKGLAFGIGMNLHKIIKGVLWDLPKAIIKFIPRIFNGMIIARNWISFLSDLMGSGFKALGSLLTPKWLSEIFTKQLFSGTLFSKIIGTIAKIPLKIVGGAFSLIIDGVFGAIEGFKEGGFLGGLAGFVKGALTSSSISGNMLKYALLGLPFAPPFGPIIGALLGGAIQFIFDNWENIKEGASSLWKGVSGMFGDLWGYISSPFISFFKPISDGIGIFNTEVGKFFSADNQIVAMLKNLWGTISSPFVQFFEFIKAKIDEFRKDFQTKFSEIPLIGDYFKDNNKLKAETTTELQTAKDRFEQKRLEIDKLRKVSKEKRDTAGTSGWFGLFDTPEQQEAQTLEDLVVKKEKELESLQNDIDKISKKLLKLENNVNPNEIAGVRLKGGPVDVGKTYITGESGPELLLNSKDGSYEFIMGPQLLTAQEKGDIIPIIGGSKSPNSIRYGLDISTSKNSNILNNDSNEPSTFEQIYQSGKDKVKYALNSLPGLDTISKNLPSSNTVSDYVNSFIFKKGDRTDTTGINTPANFNDALSFLKTKLPSGQLNNSPVTTDTAPSVPSGPRYGTENYSRDRNLQRGNEIREKELLSKLEFNEPYVYLYQLDDGRIYIEFMDTSKYTVDKNIMPKAHVQLDQLMKSSDSIYKPKTKYSDKSLDQDEQKSLAEKTAEEGTKDAEKKGNDSKSILDEILESSSDMFKKLKEQLGDILTNLPENLQKITGEVSKDFGSFLNSLPDMQKGAGDLANAFIFKKGNKTDLNSALSNLPAGTGHIGDFVRNAANNNLPGMMGPSNSNLSTSSGGMGSSWGNTASIPGGPSGSVGNFLNSLGTMGGQNVPVGMGGSGSNLSSGNYQLSNQTSGGQLPNMPGSQIGDVSGILQTGKGYNIVQLADGTQVKREGNRNWRNNNPGNIEYGEFAKKHGAIGSDGRFAIFPSMQAGRAAKSSLIFEGKNYKDKSLTEAIARYAPPGENNTGKYQQRVLAAVGGVNKPMNQYTPEERERIMDAMQQVEGSIKTGKETVIKQGTGQLPNQSNIAGVNGPSNMPGMGGPSMGGFNPTQQAANYQLSPNTVSGGMLTGGPDLSAGTGLLSVASKYHGMNEYQNTAELTKLTGMNDVRGNNNPWCGGFVGGVLKESGYRVPKNNLSSKAYLNYGKKVEIGDAKPGDIAVFNRGGDSSKGHIGIIQKIEGNKVYLLGGNQGDSVSVTVRDINKVGGELAGIRRPDTNDIVDPQKVAATQAAGGINPQAIANAAATTTPTGTNPDVTKFASTPNNINPNQSDPSNWKPTNSNVPVSTNQQVTDNLPISTNQKVTANIPTTGVDNPVQIDESLLKQDLQNGNLSMFASTNQGMSDVTDITNPNAMIGGYGSTTRGLPSNQQVSDQVAAKMGVQTSWGSQSGQPQLTPDQQKQMVGDQVAAKMGVQTSWGSQSGQPQLTPDQQKQMVGDQVAAKMGVQTSWGSQSGQPQLTPDQQKQQVVNTNQTISDNKPQPTFGYQKEALEAIGNKLSQQNNQPSKISDSYKIENSEEQRKKFMSETSGQLTTPTKPVTTPTPPVQKTDAQRRQEFMNTTPTKPVTTPTPPVQTGTESGPIKLNADESLAKQLTTSDNKVIYGNANDQLAADLTGSKPGTGSVSDTHAANLQRPQYGSSGDAIDAGFKEGASKPVTTPTPPVQMTEEQRAQAAFDQINKDHPKSEFDSSKTHVQPGSVELDKRVAASKVDTHAANLQRPQYGSSGDAIDAGFKEGAKENAAKKASGTESGPPKTVTENAPTIESNKASGTEMGPPTESDQLEKDLQTSVDAGLTEGDKLEKDLADSVEAGSKKSSGGGSSRQVSSSGGGSRQVSSGSGYQQQMSTQPQLSGPMAQYQGMGNSFIQSLFGSFANVGQSVNAGFGGNNILSQAGGLLSSGINQVGGLIGGGINQIGGFLSGGLPTSTGDLGGFSADNSISGMPPQTQFDIPSTTSSAMQSSAESQIDSSNMIGDSISSGMIGGEGNTNSSSVMPTDNVFETRHNAPQAGGSASGMMKDDMGSVPVDPLGDDIAAKLFSLLSPSIFYAAKNQAMETKQNNYIENNFS